MRVPAALLAALIVTTASHPARAADAAKEATVCRIMHARTKNVGVTITFVGEYMTDYIERTLILPKGCDRGVGLGELAPEADKLIEQVANPLSPRDRKIEATFTGILVQGEPNGFTFHKDDGVRLNVTAITDLKVVDPPSH